VIGSANLWHSSGKVPGYVSIDDAGDAAVRAARRTINVACNLSLNEAGRRATPEAG